MQTFRELRERDCYYVDKTAYIERLLAEGKHYFLSRPRRFGKSLLVDTLKELFEGSQELFEGLHIHNGRDWVRHPVVRLDFSGGDYLHPDGLRRNVTAQLARIERQEQVATDTTGPERLGFLLEALHRKEGLRVAVLVDEYDKPILDALGDPEIADANRRFLRSLYSNVKFAEAHVHFTFLTGVSKFTNVSVFSDLNNLTDITLDRRYSAICGYTESDLDTVFAPELDGLDREQVRERYNGYRWRGAEKMYNPYDVLLLFDSREFKAPTVVGGPTTQSPTTRAITRASSTPILRRSATLSWWRSRAATAGWTWRYVPAGTCICSSSRSRNSRLRGRRWRSCVSVGTLTSAGAGANRST